MVDTGLCKKPKFRFPNIFGFVSTETAAKKIIQAHRLNLKEASIPRYQLYVNNILRSVFHLYHWLFLSAKKNFFYLHFVCRCFPINCFYLAKDFVDTGVMSDKM